MAQTVPLPVHDPIANPRKKGITPQERDENEGRVTDAWIKWFQSGEDRLATAASIKATVELENRSASIGTTSITSNALSAGIYRLAYYARITTAASVSSSLDFTFSWVDDGVTVTTTTTSLTGNTTGTFGSGSLLIMVDNTTQVTYAATRASVGATAMIFKATFTLEAM